MRKLIPLFVLALLGMGTSLPELPPSPGIEEEGRAFDASVSFRNDIWPFFQVKCNTPECHGKTGEAFPKYNTYVMIKAKIKKIVKRLEDTKDPMPPPESGIKVTREEIAMLNSWIDSGRPNN